MHLKNTSSNIKNKSDSNRLLKGKIISAICASPALVLAPLGLLDGKKATCYPGCEEQFTKKVVFSEERVVADGNIITSRGPGTAIEFSLELYIGWAARTQHGNSRRCKSRSKN